MCDYDVLVPHDRKMRFDVVRVKNRPYRGVGGGGSELGARAKCQSQKRKSQISHIFTGFTACSPAGVMSRSRPPRTHLLWVAGALYVHCKCLGHRWILFAQENALQKIKCLRRKIEMPAFRSYTFPSRGHKKKIV